MPSLARPSIFTGKNATSWGELILNTLHGDVDRDASKQWEDWTKHVGR